MKLSEFKKKYYSMRNVDLMKELGISMVTLSRIVKEYGIERKPKGTAGKRKIQIERD